MFADRIIRRKQVVDFKYTADRNYAEVDVFIRSAARSALSATCAICERPVGVDGHVDPYWPHFDDRNRCTTCVDVEG